jgi:hypothetical protein
MDGRKLQVEISDGTGKTNLLLFSGKIVRRLWWPVDEIMQTLIWNIYLQDIKIIFHMTYKQREMNSLPVILTYFIQGGGKCLFFTITLLLIYNYFCFFNVDSKLVFIFKTIYHIHHHLGLYRVVSCCEISFIFYSAQNKKCFKEMILESTLL